MKKKYILLVVISSFVSVAAVFTYAAQHHMIGAAAVAAPTELMKEPVYTPSEIASFDDMVAVFHKMDSLDNYAMQGVMEGIDPGDSTNQLHTTFEFIRRGKEFYYRMGDNEMISLRDVYITTDLAERSLYVSAPRSVELPRLMQNEKLSALWQEESYAITRDTAGTDVSIRLLCEQHASCKEMRITYNAVSHLLTSSYMRLTDINDPFNKAKDKIASVRINNWSLQPSFQRLDRFQYVSGANGNWQAARHYAGFKMINK